MLRRYHPLWMSIHFMHPTELTPEVAQACERLADAGIPLGSQTVLTRGVNDDVETMKRLVHGLLQIRVRPYYLYQCDPISGSGHFRTPVEKGLEIIAGLRGHTTGYAVPTFVIDAPGGGGKIPLYPGPGGRARRRLRAAAELRGRRVPLPRSGGANVVAGLRPGRAALLESSGTSLVVAGLRPGRGMPEGILARMGVRRDSRTSG